MAKTSKSSTVTDDLAIFKKKSMKLGDMETNLRYEIIKLEELIKSLNGQLGRITSAKADLEKSKARMYKQGYRNAALELSKKIQVKKDSAANLKKIIDNHKADLDEKNKKLEEVTLEINITFKEISHLTQKNKNNLNLAKKQAETDRELAIHADVPGPCLKSIQVTRLDNGYIEIRYCGVGNRTDIRNKCRIIAPNRDVYRKDAKDIEPVLIPIHREHSS